MLDSFDYKEPNCVLCGGKEFYSPNSEAPNGRIPVDRVISKVDSLFDKNNFNEAGRLLEYWKDEAVSLKDLAGELSMQSELVGYYRKTNNKEKAYESITRALELVDKLQQSEMASGATIFLNCATAFKAFNEPEKAIVLYEKAEIIYKKVLTLSDQRFGGLYNNMALALVDLKRFNDAELSYKRALEIMTNVPNAQADVAITYVNMAHLYEEINLEDKITDCLFNAYNFLNDENTVKNGYYAYVCEKCAPSFNYFGYGFIANELKKRSEEIYERA